MAGAMVLGKHSSSEVLTSVLAYALCSSLMLVINKVAISFIPLPACVFFVQFATTVSIIVCLQAVSVLKADALTLPRVKQFAPYVGSFVISIYCNGKVLQYSNVETLITFRSCTPLAVSFLDWLVLGRELPSRRSLAALLGVVAGGVGYVRCDSEFRLHGLWAYGWVFIYLSGNVFEMTYGKFVLARVKFESPIWGSVLYTNALSLGPMAVVALTAHEPQQLRSTEIELRGALSLLVCCIAGIGISWSGWNCREKTSATTYTLLGVACKLISVLVNVLMWEKHASSAGIRWLGLCLLCSSLYRQAPLRSPKVEAAEDAAEPPGGEGATAIRGGGGRKPSASAWALHRATSEKLPGSARLV